MICTNLGTKPASQSFRVVGGLSKLTVYDLRKPGGPGQSLMFSEDIGRWSREEGGWKWGLVLPVDADGTSSQCLAPKPSGVLIVPHLTTHSAVAPLGTAGAFIQNPTNKDAAVKKYLLEGREREPWLSCGTNCHCGQQLRATPQDPKCHLSHNSNSLR